MLYTMANITVYLPRDIELKARKAARARKLTVNRWIAEEVSKAVKHKWPPEFLAAAGSCPDFPSLDEIRSGYGKDTSREPMN